MKSIHLVLTGLTLAVAGCVTVQTVQPAEFFQTHGPEVVWVTTNDHVRTPVAQAQIVGDSLEGTRQGCPQDAVAISLKEIDYVQAKLPSRTRTALLLSLVGVAVIGASFMIATTADNFDATSCCRHTKGTPDVECPCWTSF